MTKQVKLAQTQQVVSNLEPNEVGAALLIQLNGYVAQNLVQELSTLSASEIYRRQQAGTFPEKVHIGNGQRKAYRIQDIRSWLDNPTDWGR